MLLFWTLELFRLVDPGVYWAQLDLKESTKMADIYVVVAKIIKSYHSVFAPDDVISIMEDNWGDVGLEQKKDVDRAIYLNSGNYIFLIFLD